MAAESIQPEHCLAASNAKESDMTQNQAAMLTLQQQFKLACVTIYVCEDIKSSCEGHTLSVTTKTFSCRCAMCWLPDAESAVPFGTTATPTTRLSFHVELTPFTYTHT